MEGRRLYFTLDDPEENKNRQLIQLADAEKLNSSQFKKGIFHTVNLFKGNTNLEENCVKLCYWYADLDNFDMPLSEVVYAAGLYPSRVVKTKSGMHLYWRCEDATRVNYSLLNKRLTLAFGVNRSVHDVSRILRVPGYYHWKQADSPFLCETIWEADVTYTENQVFMACRTPHEDEKADQMAQVKEFKKLVSGDDFFTWLEQQNQMDLLQHLSGKACVNGEIYTFRPTGKGKHAIFVSGVPSNCWIDSAGRIGSTARGGPLVYSWLRYFNMEPVAVVRILKQEFAQWI